MILPENVKSRALEIPIILGRNQLLHASGTIPLLLNTNPNLASSDAILMSPGSCMDAPIPTAAPLQAKTIGFKNLYILKVRIPPESLLKSLSVTAKLSKDGLNVSSPLLRSAPAQNALPAPEMITAFKLSSASIMSKALISSSRSEEHTSELQ